MPLLQPLTGPFPQMMRCPGQIVWHVQSINGCVIVGVVEDREEDEFDGREGGVVVPQEERGGRVDHVHLDTAIEWEIHDKYSDTCERQHKDIKSYPKDWVSGNVFKASHQCYLCMTCITPTLGHPRAAWYWQKHVMRRPMWYTCMAVCSQGSCGSSRCYSNDHVHVSTMVQSAFASLCIYWEWCPLVIIRNNSMKESLVMWYIMYMHALAIDMYQMWMMKYNLTHAKINTLSGAYEGWIIIHYTLVCTRN